MQSRTTTRSTRTTITGIVGCAAVVLGLVPAVAVAVADPGTDEVGADGREAAAVQTVRTRLAALEVEADEAGRAAQIADEAVLRNPGSDAGDEADEARDALVALAAEQTPVLTRLAGRLDALGVDPADDGAPTATAAALSGSTRALRAVSFARRQIGDPYGYAKAGPGAWDCSGLTMKAYSAVKVGVGGHGATAQWAAAKREHRLASWNNRRRGDLIFYGRPGAVYHVAIYTGNGRMIEAPYPGKQVREVPVRSGDRLPNVARPTR